MEHELPFEPEGSEPKPPVAVRLTNSQITAITGRRAGESEYFLVSGQGAEADTPKQSYYATKILDKEGGQLTNGEIRDYIASHKPLTVMVYSLPMDESQDRAAQDHREQMYYVQFVE